MTAPRRRDYASTVLSKVPQVTALFWVAKLLTTGMGETTWDWMDGVLGVGPALIGSAVLLAAALAVQFAVRRYHAAIYWFAIVMVSVFGTTLADTVHNELGVPYTVSTIGLLVLVGAVFALWYASERTLSIHSVHTRRREGFYWAAVLLTFALGTAAGDWTATTLHLGYLPSGLLFGVAFLLPGLAYRYLGANPILTFWIAYILTRPLGASFADWFGGPRGRGGLALGMAPTTIVLSGLIVAVVTWFAVSGRDRQDEVRDTDTDADGHVGTGVTAR